MIAPISVKKLLIIVNVLKLPHMITSILMVVVSADSVIIGVLAKFTMAVGKGIPLSVHAWSCAPTVTVKRLVPNIAIPLVSRASRIFLYFRWEEREGEKNTSGHSGQLPMDIRTNA